MKNLVDHLDKRACAAAGALANVPITNLAQRTRATALLINAATAASVAWSEYAKLEENENTKVMWISIAGSWAKIIKEEAKNFATLVEQV